MHILDTNKQNALKELLEALSKGIDILSNENLNQNLYEAFEKYALSTIKLVDEAYNQEQLPFFSSFGKPYNYSRHLYSTDYPHIPLPHSARAEYFMSQQSTEYREKLKDLLQRLISIAKKVIYE